MRASVLCVTAPRCVTDRATETRTLGVSETMRPRWGDASMLLYKGHDVVCSRPPLHLGALVSASAAARLAKAQQVLERVLHQQPGHDAHGGGQAGGAHALALERALVDPARNDQRRHARKARGHARYDHLPGELSSLVRGHLPMHAASCRNSRSHT